MELIFLIIILGWKEVLTNSAFGSINECNFSINDAMIWCPVTIAMSTQVVNVARKAPCCQKPKPASVEAVSGRVFIDLEVIKAKQLHFENAVNFQSKAKDLDIGVYLLGNALYMRKYFTYKRDLYTTFGPEKQSVGDVAKESE